MGKALAEAFPVCRETFAEADAALGEPLSRLCFEGPEDQLTLTENTQPAILARQHRRVPPAHVARATSRRSSPATASASTRPTSRPARCRSPTRCASCAGAAATCRRPCRSARARWPRSSASTPSRWRRRARRPREGEVVSPANLNGAGQVVIAGARDAVARAGERAKALGREARRAAAGQRAVPLRADEAGRGAAGARAARAARPTTRACRSSPTSTRSRSATRARRDRGARRAGVVAGALGSGRPPPCVRGRHNVC